MQQQCKHLKKEATLPLQWGKNLQAGIILLVIPALNSKWPRTCDCCDRASAYSFMFSAVYYSITIKFIVGAVKVTSDQVLTAGNIDGGCA
jgi:hypothetical protein